MRPEAVIYVVGFVSDRILSGPDYDFIIINIAQIIIIVNMPKWGVAPWKRTFEIANRAV